MDTTLILARMMGIFSIVVGFAMYFRKKLILEIVHDFFKDRIAAFWVGSLELLFGTFIIIIHWEWNTLLEIIISIFGIILFLEGFFYIMVTNDQFKKLHKMLKLKHFYWVGFAWAILSGFLLIGLSFG